MSGASTLRLRSGTEAQPLELVVERSRNARVSKLLIKKSKTMKTITQPTEAQTKPNTNSTRLIPQGQTREYVKIRKQMIMNFYAQWIASNPNKQIFNANLNDFIYVRFLSIQETAEHASLNYKSTKAITYLTEILELATVKTRKKPKLKVANQKRFSEIIVMEYDNSELGKLKLTVGVLRGSKQHIQYCITAIEKTAV